METTRLQPRERPYNLNVELARCRLMKIVQKQEDWNLFDFPRAERFAEQFKAAQTLLGQALGKLAENPDLKDAARLKALADARFVARCGPSSMTAAEIAAFREEFAKARAAWAADPASAIIAADPGPVGQRRVEHAEDSR